MPTSINLIKGWTRHLGHLLSPNAMPATRIALERDADVRLRRLRGAASDRARQRIRPTRPKMRALIATPGGRMRWRSIPAPPPPGPDAATVRPIAIATCDMDRADRPRRDAVPAAPLLRPRMRRGRPGGRRAGRHRRGRRSRRRPVPDQLRGLRSLPGRATPRTASSVPPISMYGFGVAGGHWGGAVADELAVPFADGMLVKLPEGIDPVAAASVADNVSDAHRHIAPHLPAILERGGDPRVRDRRRPQPPAPVHRERLDVRRLRSPRALGATEVVHRRRPGRRSAIRSRRSASMR